MSGLGEQTGSGRNKLTGETIARARLTIEIPSEVRMIRMIGLKYQERAYQGDRRRTRFLWPWLAGENINEIIPYIFL